MFYKSQFISKKSKARLGIIKTSHGQIKTPAFVPVATKGTLKALPSQLIKDLSVQVAFVNTYHLVTHPGAGIIEKAGGIHRYASLNIPLMSDSGGFQVFSLARRSRNNIGELATPFDEKDKLLITKINEEGVVFRSTFDGQLIEFTPEKSMEYQRKIGADINMAFDECTYYPASYEYAKKAMVRTHEWLKRCAGWKLESRNLKPDSWQYLYGVIQGATFEDLRKESAKFVANQDVDGVAIGGVSVGETKKEMREQVKWVSEYLPKNKPVHLLGVGHIDDIFDLVKYGIDTFDCVEPTRLARMGGVYQISNIKFLMSNKFSKSKIGEIDILKGKYKNDLSPLDEECRCFVCTKYTKSYIHHLFKMREILGYTLATYHNLWVMERLMEQIREKIRENQI